MPRLSKLVRQAIRPAPQLLVLQLTCRGPRGTRILDVAMDTGATYTVIPVEAAIAIGCDPHRSVERIEIITAGSSIYVPVVTIPALTVLGYTLKSVKAVCHDLPPRSPVSGLLGLNVLRQFNVLLAFPDHYFEISQ